MRKRDIHGSWVVTEQKFLNEDEKPLENFYIVRAEFQIHKDGDVIWKPHPNSEHFPFMKSENFRLVKEIVYPSKSWLLIFHLQNGQSFRFRIKLMNDGQLMELVFSNLFQLKCKREICDVAVNDNSLSFLDALKSSEFSDIEIIAKNGQHFRCHKCILSCTLPDEDLNASRLSRNPEVLETVLCYMYTGFLPLNLNTEKANKVLKFAKKRKSLNGICRQLQEFLDSTGVKNRLTIIISDIGSGLNNMCSLVEGALGTYGDKKKDHSRDAYVIKNLFEDPSKCLHIIKELIKEISVCVLRWLLFCDLFTQKKKNLSKQDKDELLKKITETSTCYGERILQIQEVIEPAFLDTSLGTISDLAGYLLPEIEHLLELACSLKADMICGLDKMIKDRKQNNPGKRKEQKGAIWKIKNMVYLRELMKLKNMSDYAEKVFENLSSLSDELKSASQLVKRSKVTRNLQEYMEAVFCAKRIPESVIENGQSKKTKVLIKIMISILARTLEIVRTQKTSVSNVIKTVTNAMKNEKLNPILQELGLLSQHVSLDAEAPDPVISPIESEKIKSSENESIAKLDADNHLTKSLQNLLESEKFSDMEFHVSNTSDKSDVAVFKTHCVVVATRCRWFNRALHSGMKESIEGKFYIEGCSPEIFKMFLQYLYGATVEDFENLPEEALADLLTLADRYETEDLVKLCEFLLAKCLDEKDVFLILSFADNIGAQNLKSSALRFIKDGHHLIEADDMEKLSNDLQDEVRKILQSKPKQDDSKDENIQDCQKNSGNQLPAVSVSTHQSQFESNSSSSNESLSRDHSPECSHNVSTSSSDGETTNDVYSCIQELRMILGPDIPASELMQIAVNADFNVNRAVNFYFE